MDIDRQQLKGSANKLKTKLAKIPNSDEKIERLTESQH